MSSTTGIGLFSSGMWLNLGSPTDITASSISGWVTQPQVVGQLNNYIGTCYQPSGYTGAGSWNYDVAPDLGNEEFALLEQMYYISYYNTLIRRLAGAGGTQKIIESFSEGDRKVSYVSQADLARVYSDNVKEAQKTLIFKIGNYVNNSMGANSPRSVDYYTFLPPGANVNWRTGW